MLYAYMVRAVGSLDKGSAGSRREGPTNASREANAASC